MGFFNSLRDRFLGKRMEQQARKKTLQSYDNPYSNLGNHYGDLNQFNSTTTPDIKPTKLNK